jgi:chemotaxis signal transduction protein
MPERLTRVPLASSEIAGVLNLRGRIVTVVDMRARLGLPKADDGKPMAVGVDQRGESYGLLIDQIGEVLQPYQLSAGEKQMLAILLTVLVEDNQSYVLFMDEPEISLHFEWQKQLISLVLKLNPNIQIIMTTHSPAVVMDGWTDRVTEVNDITIK